MIWYHQEHMNWYGHKQMKRQKKKTKTTVTETFKKYIFKKQCNQSYDFKQQKHKCVSLCEYVLATPETHIHFFLTSANPPFF